MANAYYNPNGPKYQMTSERSQAALCTKLVKCWHYEWHLEKAGRDVFLEIGLQSFRTGRCGQRVAVRQAVAFYLGHFKKKSLAHLLFEVLSIYLWYRSGDGFVVYCSTAIQMQLTVPLSIR